MWVVASSAGAGDETVICTPSGFKKCFENEASVYVRLDITGENEALLRNLFLRQKILDNLPDERVIAHLLKDSSEDLTDELRTYIDYIVAMAKAALPYYAASRKKFHISIIDIRINKEHSLFGRSLQKLNKPNGKDKAIDEIYKLVDKFLRAKPSMRILEDYKVLGIQKTFLVREMMIDDPNDIPFKILQNEIMSLISTPQLEVLTDASVDVPVFTKQEDGNFIYSTIDGPYAALSYYDYFNNTSRKLHSSMTDLSDSQIAKILQRPDLEFSKIFGTEERNEIKRIICENIKAIFSKLDFKNDRWGEFKDSELGDMIAEKGKILVNVNVNK